MNDTYGCCNRTMTSVGIAQDGVQLHSCPACGQHAWTRDGRRLERAELLQALRSAPAVRASLRTSPRPAALPAQAELKDLLRGFTLHGTAS